MIHVTPDAPRADAYSVGGGVHTNALHSRNVNHQAVSTGPKAGATVAATANRSQKAVLPA